MFQLISRLNCDVNSTKVASQYRHSQQLILILYQQLNLQYQASKYFNNERG